MNTKQKTRVTKILMNDLNKAIAKDGRLINRGEKKIARLQKRYDRLQARLAAK